MDKNIKYNSYKIKQNIKIQKQEKHKFKKIKVYKNRIKKRQEKLKYIKQKCSVLKATKSEILHNLKIKQKMDINTFIEHLYRDTVIIYYGYDIEIYGKSSYIAYNHFFVNKYKFKEYKKINFERKKQKLTEKNIKQINKIKFPRTLLIYVISYLKKQNIDYVIILKRLNFEVLEYIKFNNNKFGTTYKKTKIKINKHEQLLKYLQILKDNNFSEYLKIKDKLKIIYLNTKKNIN